MRPTDVQRKERRRDGQQWLLDWMAKTTGRVQNFAYDTAQHPPEVKAYRQIPKVIERYARHAEQVARGAEAAGHRQTAFEHYWRAADHYRDAQHPLYWDDHPDKIYLHGKLLECYAKVIELAPYLIKRVEIPFEGQQIQCNFHMTGEPNAPTVIEVPGMDQTKENYPRPTRNPFVQRGMNVISMDGPGQGTSNMRKIRVTDDNYQRAGAAVIDWLVEQPEVDASRIGVSGISMGSYWGMRIAAYDERVAALATASACFSAKRAIFEEDSPRFKQMFMYMAGMHDESEFDEMAVKMTMEGHSSRIRCPSLTVIGEYDPLCPLDEAIPIWEEIQGPREMWVLEDDFHSPPAIEGLGGEDVYYYMADFLRDAFDGKIEDGRDVMRVVPKKTGAGPYEPPTRGIYLPDRLNTP